MWTDNAVRRVISFKADSNNLVDVLKRNTAGGDDIRFRYYAGGTKEEIDLDITETAWMHFAITWDKTADAVKAYYQGSQTGATASGLGVWAGLLASTTTIIGSLDTTPALVWDGWLAHAAVWTKALLAAQIADIYNASGI